MTPEEFIVLPSIYSRLNKLDRSIELTRDAKDKQELKKIKNIILLKAFALTKGRQEGSYKKYGLAFVYVLFYMLLFTCIFYTCFSSIYTAPINYTVMIGSIVLLVSYIVCQKYIKSLVLKWFDKRAENKVVKLFDDFFESKPAPKSSKILYSKNNPL